MESRKVQLTGGATYIVALPIWWVRKQNIQIHDDVYFSKEKDGTLRLLTESLNKPEPVEKIIPCSDIETPEKLLGDLLAAYVAGYGIIRITCEDRLPAFTRGTVRDFIQKTIGMEIIEDAAGLLIIKDLLNREDINFENTMKRLTSQIIAVQADTRDAIQYNHKDLADDIDNRFSDIARLCLLMTRQANLKRQ